MKKKPKIAVIGLKGLPAFGGAAAVGENIIDQLKDRFDFTVYSVASHTNNKTGPINGIQQIVFRNHGKGSVNTLIYYLKPDPLSFSRLRPDPSSSCRKWFHNPFSPASL